MITATARSSSGDLLLHNKPVPWLFLRERIRRSLPRCFRASKDVTFNDVVEYVRLPSRRRHRDDTCAVRRRIAK